MTASLLANNTVITLGIAGGVLLLALAALLLWLVFGRAPRRHRAYRQARQFVQQGRWEDALAAVREMLQMGGLAPVWEGRIRNVQGEAHHTAGEAALKARRYEDALKHYTIAADFLQLPVEEFRSRVIDAMMSEALRAFAEGITHNEAAHKILARILAIQPVCPAASFWQGLCHLRDNQLDLAQAALTRAHEDGGKAFLDPPLYLGMLHLRRTRPQEALRSLADANRIDSSCPFVPLFMGRGIVEAGGDSALAVRALERALGPRGLGRWEKTPQRAWSDAMPEGRSYIRRLAARHEFTCPLLGSDLGITLYRGRFALGQAYSRLGRFQEAADVFARLLQDAPPTAEVLRHHGLALTRLGQYDQAYKQLRIALDKDPMDHLSAGYLALCGALGKPSNPDDKPRNVTWAIQQMARYEIYGDPEWAELYSRICAEARSSDIPVPAEDQLRLCDVLASVFATDANAVAAYDHLAVTAPDLLRSEHAWIYCQAAHAHGFRGQRDLEMFRRTFSEIDAVQPFYQQRGWDYEALELTYLQRAAQAHPGRFPEEMGPYYADRGATLLLRQSRAQEEADNLDAALATVEVLLALAPTNPLAHDRLAHLYYKKGDLDRAAALLAGWHRLQPTNHLPLVRRAVLAQQRGQANERAEALQQALAATQGKLRGSIALLGARLALMSALGPAEGFRRNGDAHAPQTFAETVALLEECLREKPDDPTALWLLAAVRSLEGDRVALSQLAPRLTRPAEPDSRFHFLAAVCHLAASDPAQALEACRRAWGEPSLTVECRYLLGWAHLHLGEESGALREWEVVAASPDCVSAPYAQALLGRLRFRQGKHEQAIAWWSGLDPHRRREWGLEDPLRSTVFLAGLLDLDAGRFDLAAERFREAGKLGRRDPSLGSLIVLSLIKAGQARLYPEREMPASRERGFADPRPV